MFSSWVTVYNFITQERKSLFDLWFMYKRRQVPLPLRLPSGMSCSAVPLLRDSLVNLKCFDVPMIVLPHRRKRQVLRHSRTCMHLLALHSHLLRMPLVGHSVVVHIFPLMLSWVRVCHKFVSLLFLNPRKSIYDSFPFACLFCPFKVLSTLQEFGE